MYQEDEAEENRPDDVDRWALSWRNRVAPLLCSAPNIDIDTPDAAALRRVDILEQLKVEDSARRMARKARMQDERDLHEAMTSSNKRGKPMDADGENEDREGGPSSSASTEIVPLSVPAAPMQVTGVQVSPVLDGVGTISMRIVFPGVRGQHNAVAKREVGTHTSEN